MQIELPVFNNADFTTFRVEKLIDNSVTDFDLFIELEKHFILYSGNGYRWERDELHHLMGHGHERLFIRRVDLTKAQMYESLSTLPRVSRELPPLERIRTIEQVGSQFVKCLYEGELTEACVEKAKRIGEEVVQCVSEDRACVKSLSGLADHDYYTYYHSIRVATYAVAIASQMGLKNDYALREIALGGIFHDIGKKEIPLSILNKAGPLTESEWDVMRSHPRQGLAAVDETILSHVPREIVLHHHERRNGTGYPDGIDNRSLLPEVQIAALGDIFDALTSSRSYQTRRTRYEALDFIKHRLLNEEVCPDAYRALIHCLATP